MDTSDFLIESLGLQDVVIEKFKSDKDTLKAEIWVRQKRDSCRCHECYGKLYGVHQWRKRDIKGPPIGAFAEVTIHLFQLRAACDQCQQVKMAAARFIHPRFKNLTCAFAEVAGRLMEETTCEATARWLRCGSMPLWRLDQWRMEYMKKNGYELPKNLDVSRLSADEVHFRTVRPEENRWDKKNWDIKFITTLVATKHAKVIATAAGRDARALKKCLNVLSEPQRIAVEFLAVDMHDPFIRAATKLCPNADIAVDRFHLAEQINRRFDEVRRAEFKIAQEKNDPFQEGMLSPSRRFVLVEREKDLSKEDQKMLEELRELNRNIHNAMLIVEYFHAVLDKKSVKSFRKALESWYRLVKESNLKPFRDFAKLIRKYRLNIEAYVRSGLTTAVSEGINNKIKVLKRMGYGYTNQKSFENKILQRCGFLNSTYINTNSWFWHVPPPP